MNEINHFLELHAQKHGMAFIDAIFDVLDFSYTMAAKDRQNIPAQGKLICVANHPLGALDGLALLKAISEIRSDVRIIVNDVLAPIDNLSGHFIPYDIFSKKPQKQNANNIQKSLMNDEVVIFFPAAQVSRLSLHGIRDGHWQSGAVRFAEQLETPILPVYIKGRNSTLFYLISLLHQSFSMFLLAHQIFRYRSKTFEIKIGKVIPGSTFKSDILPRKTKVKLLKKHVYQIGKNGHPVFTTENTIIHPVDRKSLQQEIKNGVRLGLTNGHKEIRAISYQHGPMIIKEISRLRELVFRHVGEGSGKKCDFDDYDKTYHHIFIWDREQLEIVGAYRIGICRDIMASQGVKGLYNASLFHFQPAFIDLLKESAELGRSFIQIRYWRTNALESLWLGVAAFLQQTPGIRYVFGAVSISDTYSEQAKNMIVYFYQKWFGRPSQSLVLSKNPYRISKGRRKELGQLFSGETMENDFKTLKATLKNYGYSVPVLFRRYTELAPPEGIRFLDFGIDAAFSHVVDGFFILDLQKLYPHKHQRYFGVSQPEETRFITV